MLWLALAAWVLLGPALLVLCLCLDAVLARSWRLEGPILRHAHGEVVKWAVVVILAPWLAVPWLLSWRPRLATIETCPALDRDRSRKSPCLPTKRPYHERP